MTNKYTLDRLTIYIYSNNESHFYSAVFLTCAYVSDLGDVFILSFFSIRIPHSNNYLALNTFSEKLNHNKFKLLLFQTKIYFLLVHVTIKHDTIDSKVKYNQIRGISQWITTCLNSYCLISFWKVVTPHFQNKLI